MLHPQSPQSHKNPRDGHDKSLYALSQRIRGGGGLLLVSVSQVLEAFGTGSVRRGDGITLCSRCANHNGRKRARSNQHSHTHTHNASASEPHVALFPHTPHEERVESAPWRVTGVASQRNLQAQRSGSELSTPIASGVQIASVCARKGVRVPHATRTS